MAGDRTGVARERWSRSNTPRVISVRLGRRRGSRAARWSRSMAAWSALPALRVAEGGHDIVRAVAVCDELDEALDPSSVRWSRSRRSARSRSPSGTSRERAPPSPSHRAIPSFVWRVSFDRGEAGCAQVGLAHADGVVARPLGVVRVASVVARRLAAADGQGEPARLARHDPGEQIRRLPGSRFADRPRSPSASSRWSGPSPGPRSTSGPMMRSSGRSIVITSSAGRGRGRRFWCLGRAPIRAR